jgi:hypothetical protein
MANTWQGEFPWQNLKPPRKRGTSAVRSFPPNGFGLYDMGKRSTPRPRTWGSAASCGLSPVPLGFSQPSGITE